jgi:mercuric ion binding protein
MPVGAAAQRALDAIAGAGFHGGTDDAHLAMKAVSRVPRGRVKRLKVSGVHNCCDLCCEVTPGATAFEVTGDFQAAAVVQALNAAGFGAQVKR